MPDSLGNRLFPVWACAALAVCLFVGSSPAAAQKKNKKQEALDASNAAASAAASQALKAMLPETQLIDQTISEALSYWQIGDVDSMSKYYSKDVVVVSNAWDQPLVGWDNYAKLYSAQRVRITNARLDRSNTYIRANGDSAWATYQWEYRGSLDGQPFDSLGHTTLVLNKQDGHWVIAVDHSSAVSEKLASGAASNAVPAQASGPKNP